MWWVRRGGGWGSKCLVHVFPKSTYILIYNKQLWFYIMRPSYGQYWNIYLYILQTVGIVILIMFTSTLRFIIVTHLYNGLARRRLIHVYDKAGYKILDTSEGLWFVTYKQHELYRKSIRHFTDFLPLWKECKYFTLARLF